MAFQSHRTRFQGKLAGIEQEEISKLDYSKEVLKDRMEFIKDKYNNIEKYHEEYTSDFYKVNVNTDDNISSDINVFKAIERDANYLINSIDNPRDSQYKYNMLTQEEFDKKIKDEKKADLFSEELIDMVEPDFNNDYINMDLTITNKDIIENTEMGSILRNYNDVKIHIKNEMANIKNKEGSYLNLVKAKMILGTINCDMLDVKKSYKGITRPASKLGDIGGEPDLLKADYTDDKQIKYLLQMVKFGELSPDNLKSHLAQDLEDAIRELVKRGRLDSIDLEIIDGINSGVSMRKLELELGISNQAISKRFTNISKKIALYFTYIELV